MEISRIIDVPQLLPPELEHLSGPILTVTGKANEGNHHQSVKTDKGNRHLYEKTDEGNQLQLVIRQKREM